MSDNLEIFNAETFFKTGNSFDYDGDEGGSPEPDGSDDDFFKAAQLAGAIGQDGHKLVEGLRKETEVIDARANAVYKGLAGAATPAKVIAESHRLAKREREQAARTVLSPNGRFFHDYDTDGNLFRSRMVE